MAKPVIALVTDFGLRDHYAAAMKGVALGICPDAVLVDVTHDVPPHDVLAGALELAACYQYFPPETVFLVVVDPGVGSARRRLAAEAGGFRFVAPDNGVLTLVFRQTPPRRVVEITERRFARPTVSRTFEGRDRFAPAAAWLARGTSLADLGPPLTAWESLDMPTPALSAEAVAGEVLRVDHFGNLVTNIERSMFDRIAAGSEGGSGIEIVAGGHRVEQVVGSYAEVTPDSVCALLGSTDHLEIAVNGGSAAERLALGRGARVTVSRLPPRSSDLRARG